MKILDVHVEYRWYDEIDLHGKTEEYREIKPYWIKRICEEFYTDGCCRHCMGEHCYECLVKGGNKIEFQKFDAIRIWRGYTKGWMLWTVEDITVGYGMEEWGAPEHHVFIIKLGKRINIKDMEKRIRVDKSLRAYIAKTFGVTERTVFNALGYDSQYGHSDMAKRIRQFAIQSGGQQTVTLTDKEYQDIAGKKIS